MDSQEIFLACLNNLQGARLYFDQGLTDDAIRLLTTSLSDLDDIDAPEEKHINLRQQIESYLETLRGLSEASEPLLVEEDIDQDAEGVDLDRLYKHAIALMDNRLWEEAIRVLQIITAYGYQTMECLELCGDASVSLEKWGDALGYYETFGHDPNIDDDDKARLHAKIVRCKEAIARRREPKSQISERVVGGRKESPREATAQRAAARPPADEGAKPVREQRAKQEDGSEVVDAKEGRDASEYERLLNIILRRIHDAKSFEDILPQLEKQMLKFLGAERLTIYQRGRNGLEIISRYKTGTEVREIRVPISPSSISGYVALTQQSLKINNVHERSLLASIHPELSFDQSFDESSGFYTQSLITVPIKQGDTPLGVLQVINCVGKDSFDDADLANAQELAQVIGQKFYYDLQATKAPFDYLVMTKKITPKKLEEIEQEAAEKKASIADLLVNKAGLSPDEVGMSLERYYQLPFLRFDPDLQPPQELLRTLNKTYLRSKLWVPVAGNRDKAVILIDDPNDHNRIMEIQQVVNARSYEFRVGLREDILRYLGASVDAAAEAGRELKLEDLVGKLGDEDLAQEMDIGEERSRIGENEAAVVQLVNRLIVDATRINASDIHIEPNKGRESATIRMRVDGVCREVTKVPASHIRAVVARIKILARLDIAERRKPQDGKITLKLHGKPIELRVATVPTVNGESAVLRILSAGEAVPLNRLDLTQRNQEEIVRLIAHPHGMFLAVGPTGSGKTTTLHAILGHINTPDRKIWTAEDPVEITQRGLQQLQVEPRIGLDFASALRSFLRADPDVILIGEMRDQETAHIGIESSLTGHLVFSTLHTNSAPETIVRLLDLGLDPLNFADALLGVLAQRLMRTLCSSCKEYYTPTNEEIDQLEKVYGPELFAEAGINKAECQLCRPVGCEKCGGTGYKGRTGIHELLVATPAMKQRIAKRADVPDIRSLAIKEGMRTLMQDGIVKILKGQTDFMQLRRVAAEQ